jgi:hypothetical protein
MSGVSLENPHLFTEQIFMQIEVPCGFGNGYALIFNETSRLQFELSGETALLSSCATSRLILHSCAWAFAMCLLVLGLSQSISLTH